MKVIVKEGETRRHIVRCDACCSEICGMPAKTADTEIGRVDLCARCDKDGYYILASGQIDRAPNNQNAM